MSKYTNEVIEWTRNYLNSFGGKTKVVIGISGGKDSSIVAAICVKAVGLNDNKSWGGWLPKKSCKII